MWKHCFWARFDPGPRRECSPHLGWESSGGELVPAVAGTVCRFWERHRAGLVPALTLAAGCVDWGAARWAAGCAGLHQTPHPGRGVVSGGRCGGSPPAQGRAEGPTAQAAVASGQELQGPGMTRLLHEVEGSVPQFWTAPRAVLLVEQSTHLRYDWAYHVGSRVLACNDSIQRSTENQNFLTKSCRSQNRRQFAQRMHA